MCIYIYICMPGELGDIGQQRELLEHALRIQQQNFGPEYREVLSSLTSLSTVYERLGDTPRRRPPFLDPSCAV